MSDLSAVQNLLCKVSDWFKEKQDVVKSGKTFNCLDICRIGDDEIRHSSIIATMLDPQGAHGLGSESLKAFFQVVCPDEPDFADKCDDCSVETEYSIEHRRMDIVIRNRNLCVVIENKTATIDHYMQLKDYYKWLDEQPVPLKRLFYLTYHGTSAVDENIKREEYYSISYERDICNWMLKCSHVAFERNLLLVQAFCNQYYSYLQQIMEASMTQEEMKEWKNIILQNETNFKSAKEIVKMFNLIRNEAIADLLKNWALDRKLSIDYEDLSSGESSCRISLICDLLQEKGLVYTFGFSSPRFRNFYYGISWKNGGSNPLDNRAFPPKDGWEQNDWFPYSKYFENEYKNPDWDNEFLFKEEKKKKLYQILDDAYNEMKALVDKLPPMK